MNQISSLQKNNVISVNQSTCLTVNITSSLPSNYLYNVLNISHSAFIMLLIMNARVVLMTISTCTFVS